MTQDEFRDLMLALADTFGIKTSGELFAHRADRYYRRFSKYDRQTISAGFDAAEAAEERFPPLNKLMEYVRIEAARKPAQKVAPVACKLCGGGGTLRASDNLGYKALFKCPACDNCSANYPTWSRDFELRGYSRILPDDGWDENSETTARGLALLGPDSIPWRKAPLPLQMTAQRLIDGGYKPKAGTLGAALVGSSDPMREAERRRHVETVERVETENADFSPF